MVDLNKIKDQVSDLAHAGVAKSKELAEIAKLRANNASSESSIRKAYSAIGEKYYELHGTAPDEDFRASCDQITAAKEKIDQNNQKIEEIKSANNISDEEVAAAEDDASQKISDAADDIETAAEDIKDNVENIGDKK
ncbi:MAG: serine proteinase [Oscillospiraceae bacterium]|nr:serine proteinase [Oscillospiraceae bacterium]